jgi:hypothetical protein
VVLGEERVAISLDASVRCESLTPLDEALHVSRPLGLAFLSPEILELILARTPAHHTLTPERLKACRPCRSTGTTSALLLFGDRVVIAVLPRQYLSANAARVAQTSFSPVAGERTAAAEPGHLLCAHLSRTTRVSLLL